MSIKDTLTESEYINRFLEVRSDNFSREGLSQLFHYFEDLSEGIGEDIEFDPVAVCCDWTEYETEAEALKAYDLGSMEELQNETVTIPCANGVLVQNY